MGFLSREIVRRVGPLVVASAAGAAGALMAQRRVAERRKLHLVAGPTGGAPAQATGPVPTPPAPAPPSPTPAPDPTPPSPTPDPIPAPTPTPDPEPPTPRPDPTPAPDPAPTPDPVPPAPIPTPEPGIAIVGGTSQGPEAAADVVEDSSPRERILEETVRSALVEAAPDGAGAVEVEVAGSMVVLRGRVDTREAIRELERAAAGVPGVEGVRVLLHLPARAVRRSA
jgi:outer membrane biosynthesis protein TonB